MTTKTKAVAGSFCWMELATTDQNAAKKFYGDVLGWTSNDFPMGPGAAYTIFQLGGKDCAAAYTLREEERANGVPPHWMLYIASDDVDASARRVAELGGVVHAQPFDVMDQGRMAVAQDPTGAMFSIWQSKQSGGIDIRNVEGAFCWADLNTSNRERAVEFYSQLFGWKLDPGEKDPSGYLHIKNGEQYIGGMLPAEHVDPKAPPHWLLYFQTSQCDVVVDRARRGGANVYFGPVTMKDVGRYAVLSDGQGAAFSVFQSARQANVA